MAGASAQWTIGVSFPIDLPKETCAQLSWYYNNGYDKSGDFTAPNGHAYYIDFKDGLQHRSGQPTLTQRVFLDGQPLKPGVYAPVQGGGGPSVHDEMPPPEDKGAGEVSSLRCCALAADCACLK